MWVKRQKGYLCVQKNARARTQTHTHTHKKKQQKLTDSTRDNSL